MTSINENQKSVVSIDFNENQEVQIALAIKKEINK